MPVWSRVRCAVEQILLVWRPLSLLGTLVARSEWLGPPAGSGYQISYVSQMSLIAPNSLPANARLEPCSRCSGAILVSLAPTKLARQPGSQIWVAGAAGWFWVPNLVRELDEPYCTK